MKFRYKNRFDKERRDLLNTIAKAGVSSALLRACGLVGGMMMARASEGQSRPNKSLLLFKAGGALDELWRPGSGMKLGSMSEPYESVKSEMNFVAGGTMNQNAFGHGVMFAHFTGNSFSADSFDVNMGRTIGANAPLRYLNLGVQCKATLLSRQGNSGVPTIDSPTSAFALLSGNVGGGGGGGGGGGTSDPRKLYVDAHKDAITTLRQKLGQHEKEKLDSHLASISELEAKLSTGTGNPNPGASCSSVTMPSGQSGNFDQIAKLQTEIAILALKCGITNSVSIAFGEDNHQFNIPVYAQVVHQSHHCCPGVADYTITAKYMAGLCANVISRAKAEGILDSTLITQVTDMGDGRAHNNVNVPLFVAGGGGAIGRNKVTTANGKNVNDLFQSVANALGASEHPNARRWSTAPISL